MKLLRQALALTLALLFVCLSFNIHAQARRPVSLILVNGKVFTADARGRIAQAIAVDGVRIVAVGTNEQIRAAFESEHVIDLKGRLVTPGFNDAHLHFVSGGLSLMRVQLLGAESLAEAKRRIAEKVQELPPGSWILGRGWDHTLWGGQWPTRKDLDEVAPNNPVFVQRVDGHTSWANSLALQKANITRATEDPKGGEIRRDAQGEPTGILHETAAELVARVVPEPARAEKMQAIERALAEARRYGITSIQDFSPPYENVALYRELLAADKLTVRIATWQDFELPVAELQRQRADFASFRIDPFRIRLTMLKGYVDGTLGSHTAAMLAPFADDPHNSGIPRHAPEELTRMVIERAAAGFQIGFHAIGDKANRMALDAFAAAEKQSGRAGFPHGIKPSNEPSDFRQSPPPRDYGSHEAILFPDFPRHRVEHAQVVAPSDFARFRDLGVIASMQPSHAISDKRWAEDRLGEYRVMGAYAWHTMMSYGVHVPFGTDWPVEPINPYLGLYAAVTRQSTDGQPIGGWWPEERITIEEAIRNYTAESAYASFEEKDKGQIAPGMLADLTVHTRDLLTIRPAEILQTEAAMTILGGRIVYELHAADASLYLPRESSETIIQGGASAALPGKREALIFGGFKAFEQKDYKRAAEAFRVALNVQGDSESARGNPADIYYYLGVVSETQGQYDEALAAYQQCLQLKPDTLIYLSALYNMANTYAAGARYKEAIDAYKLVAKLRPDLAPPHYNMALAYVALKDLTQAINEFKAAVGAQDDYAKAHFNLGLAYCQQGKPDEARAEYQGLQTLDAKLAARLHEICRF